MTSIYSNNSHKKREPNNQNIAQPSEQQDALNASSEVERSKVLAQDRESEVFSTDEQLPLEINQQVEETPTTSSSPALTIQKPRFTPKMVMFASVVTVAILGSAIAGIYFRTEQYKKINSAQALFNEACHTPTLADAGAVNTAETNWNNAMAQLQGIPQVPGFGVRDAQALKDNQNYARCKANIDATKFFQEAAVTSQAARWDVQHAPFLIEEKWQNHVNKLKEAIDHLRLIQTNFDNPADLAKTFPIFSDAQKQLKEYETIRTSAQQRLTDERNAVQNFNAANDRHEWFRAHQNATTDAEWRGAEANLQSAIDLLKKIPTAGTTVSEKAIERRQNYEKILARFKAEPARQQLRQLDESFRQLSNALEARSIPREEFASSLDDITSQLGQLREVSSISQHPALPHFQAALNDYRFVQDLLHVCYYQPDDCFIGRWDSDKYLRDTSPLYRTLIDFYQVEPVLTSKGKAIRLESATERTAFAAIWQSADRNVKRAEELIEQ
jgi:hypothetical protein